MNKLRQLRKWLTVSEAAGQLSRDSGDEVTEADVLRLALEGHLSLAVDLVNGSRASGQSASAAAARDDGRWEFDEPVEMISGVWNLPMIGGERLSVEARFQKLSGGPAVVLESPKGVLVERAGRHFQLQGESSFLGTPFRSSGLPPDSQLVVPTVALRDFQARSIGSTRDTSLDRPVHMKERATLLVIIAALATEAKIDYNQPSKAGVAIDALTSKMGARIPGRTVEEHLKRIPDALERRARHSS